MDNRSILGKKGWKSLMRGNDNYQNMCQKLTPINLIQTKKR
jgi:hypothetical protein